MIPGTIFCKTAKDGRYVSVIPLSFRRARIVIGRTTWDYDDGW